MMSLSVKAGADTVYSSLFEYITAHPEVKNLFVVSQGGGGKTTQLHYVHRQLIEQAKNGAKAIPIYIDVKLLKEADKTPIYKYILDTFQLEIGWEELDGFFQKQQKDGYEFYLLLDGYNEAPDALQTALLFNIRLLTNTPGVHLVITSRSFYSLDEFTSFQKVTLCGLSKEQVINYLSQRFQQPFDETSFHPSLLEILQTPIYLNAFVKTYSGKESIDSLYGDKVVRRADLLNEYLQKLKEDLSADNSLLTNTESTRFVVDYYLPAFAFKLAIREELGVTNEGWKELAKELNADYFSMFFDADERPALPEPDAVLRIIVYQLALLHKTGSRQTAYYSMHQVWRDVLAAKHICNLIYFSDNDCELNFTVNKAVRQFVGELIKTPSGLSECDFASKADTQSPMSPIEAYLHKQGSNFLVVCNLVEIMKTARDNKVVADYRHLDLSWTALGGTFCANSDFRDADIDDFTFFSLPEPSRDWYYGISASGEAVALHSATQVFILKDHALRLVAENLISDQLTIKAVDFLTEDDLLISFDKAAGIYHINWQGDSIDLIGSLNWGHQEFHVLKENPEEGFSFNTQALFKYVKNAQAYGTAISTIDPALKVSLAKLSDEEWRIFSSLLEKMVNVNDITECSSEEIKQYNGILDSIAASLEDSMSEKELHPEAFGMDSLDLPTGIIEGKGFQSFVLQSETIQKLVFVINNYIVVTEYSVDDQGKLTVSSRCPYPELQESTDHYLSDDRIINYQNKGLLFFRSYFGGYNEKWAKENFKFNYLWFDGETETLWHRVLTLPFDDDFTSQDDGYYYWTFSICKEKSYLRINIYNGFPTSYSQKRTVYYDFINEEFVDNAIGDRYDFFNRYYYNQKQERCRWIDKSFFTDNDMMILENIASNEISIEKRISSRISASLITVPLQKKNGSRSFDASAMFGGAQFKASDLSHLTRYTQRMLKEAKIIIRE